MLTKDQTRLRIEKMEVERIQRRINQASQRRMKAEEEKRSLAMGNPGDVDFIGLVQQWRDDHASLSSNGQQQQQSSSQLGEDNICVCVRKRPLNTKELKKKEHDAVTCLQQHASSFTATVHSAKLRVDGISKYCDHNTFRFDYTFDELACTEDVYKYTAKPLVQYVCNSSGGRGTYKNNNNIVVPRATVFAYGQTGSGKTHTMGGIQTMVAEDIFLTLSNNSFDNNDDDDKGCCSLDNTDCSIAIFEIYGGRIQDLLNNRNRLKVLEDGKGEVVVSGLGEYPVCNPEEFLSLIEQGQNNRTTHSTEANDVSSRSHAICQILFRHKDTGKLQGKLSLVDLAGSERGSDTKNNNRQRRTESSDINTSLLALKECIRAIDSDSKHVPYRQSKLTLILKDCFVSKSARTAMIATVSPGSNSTDHTLNTLRYADRIKEQKVGNAFAPSNRSPTRSKARPVKKSPARKQTAAPPAIKTTIKKEDETRDDHYEDDFDELDEIMNTTDEQNVGAEEANELEKLSEIDITTKQLFEEEEQLLTLHMENIHEHAELLTEEGALLKSVQGEDYDFDMYASKLGDILDRKEVIFHSLRERLGSFTTLLRKEEELAGVR